jgi:branched-chain amino acid transport system permease protein
VMVGRERTHRWVLWLPNFVIAKVTGRKTAIAMPEADAS